MNIQTVLVPTWFGGDSESGYLVLEYRLIQAKIDRRTKLGKYLNNFVIPYRDSLENLYYFQFMNQKDRPFNITEIKAPSGEIAHLFQTELINTFGDRFKFLGRKPKYTFI